MSALRRSGQRSQSERKVQSLGGFNSQSQRAVSTLAAIFLRRRISRLSALVDHVVSDRSDLLGWLLTRQPDDFGAAEPVRSHATWPGERPPTLARLELRPACDKRSAIVSITGGNMAQASVVAFPGRGRTHRTSLDVGRALALREGRRIRNRVLLEHAASLRCECDRPNCTDKLPAAAEAHRGTADRFIVLPAHLNGGVVVRAADRFFVIELRRPADCRQMSADLK